MRKIKNITVILGLLLSFVTMAADNSITNEYGTVNMAGKTYTARIVSPKAIIYADENMLSPLGYIVSGKAITVGNPRRMNRDLVPLIIYGRLAFVEIKNIRYEDTSDEEYNARRGAPREHDFDIIIKKPAENLSLNNSLLFGLHTFSAGEQVKNSFLALEESEQSSFSGFHLQVIHRQISSKYFWGIGFDYSGISSTDMRFNFSMINPTVGYTPIKNSLFSLDVYASLDFSLQTEFIINNNLNEEPSAFVWGPQINARMVFFPNSKYHVFGGVGLRKYSVINAKTIKDLNENEVDGISRITGASLFVGLAIELK